MLAKHTTVENMAHEIGVDATAFGAALRCANFSPRKARSDREVKIGSEEHSAMRTVLVTLLRRSATH